MPERVTADIRRLCRKIGGVGEPGLVEVATRWDSGLNDCFMDVRKQVAEQGGSLQHGWMIWEWPGIALEGEFHAVWRKPDGELLDVSGKRNGEEHVLFVPDPGRVFAEQRVVNVRLALGQDPRIKIWIEVSHRFDLLISHQTQGVPFGTQLVLTGEALELRKKAHLLHQELEQSRMARRAMDDFARPLHELWGTSPNNRRICQRETAQRTG